MRTLLFAALLAPLPALAQAPDALVVTSEVLGQGHDGTARRAEELVRAREAEVQACRAAALEQGVSPLRYLQLQLRIQGDGTVRRTRVTSSTGDASVDACVVRLARSLRWDPPPMFPDRIQLNVTWAKPEPAPAPEDAPKP